MLRCLASAGFSSAQNSQWMGIMQNLIEYITWLLAVLKLSNLQECVLLVTLTSRALHIQTTNVKKTRLIPPNENDKQKIYMLGAKKRTNTDEFFIA